MAARNYDGCEIHAEYSPDNLADMPTDVYESHLNEMLVERYPGAEIKITRRLNSRYYFFDAAGNESQDDGRRVRDLANDAFERACKAGGEPARKRS